MFYKLDGKQQVNRRIRCIYWTLYSVQDSILRKISRKLTLHNISSRKLEKSGIHVSVRNMYRVAWICAITPYFVECETGLYSFEIIGF